MSMFTRKESVRYPGLFVEKYKRKVFYDSLWDDQLVEMRGRVVDAAGDVVINPFTKIFNRFERNTNIDDGEKVIAVEKINGFMAAATYVPSVGKVVVSTTGSLDSDYVTLAEKHLKSAIPVIVDYASIPEGKLTWLFEIVDESNPHIIKEMPGAYLLGFREVDSKESYSSSDGKEQLLDKFAIKMVVMRPTWGSALFSEVVEYSKNTEREGFVVYGKNTVLKIKSPYYLITKFFARVGENRILQVLNNLENFKKEIDEEYYDLIDIRN